MSGQYGPRTGVYTVGGIDRFDWQSRPLRPVDNVTQLPLDKVTIAAGAEDGRLRDRPCSASGTSASTATHHPGQRGFDEAIVSAGQALRLRHRPARSDYPKGTYLADFLTDKAVDFIHRHKDEPFFLYLPHFGVHSPHQAKPELIAKFKDKPAAGGHNDPTYAAMIASVDESVGRVMATLDELKLAENTLVIFTSDNGGVGGYVREGIKQGRRHHRQRPAPRRQGHALRGRHPRAVHLPLAGQDRSRARPATSRSSASTCIPTLLELAGAQAAGGPAARRRELRAAADAAASATLERDAIYWHFPGYLGAGAGQLADDARRRRSAAGDWKLHGVLRGRPAGAVQPEGRHRRERRTSPTKMPEKAKELHEKLRRLAEVGRREDAGEEQTRRSQRKSPRAAGRGTAPPTEPPRRQRSRPRHRSGLWLLTRGRTLSRDSVAAERRQNVAHGASRGKRGDGVSKALHVTPQNAYTEKLKCSPMSWRSWCESPWLVIG